MPVPNFGKYRPPAKSRSKGGLIKAFALSALGLTAIVTGYRGCTQSYHEGVYVKDKDIKRSGEEDKYMIYTDQGVFENTDAWLNFKFNSSDVYNDLEEHKYYDIKTQGWRMTFFSAYPNIIGFEPCTHPEHQKNKP